MKTLEERANWEAMQIVGELQAIPPAEAYKYLVGKLQQIQRDAREGMVEAADVVEIVTSWCDFVEDGYVIDKAKLGEKFRAKHPNLFTK